MNHYLIRRILWRGRNVKKEHVKVREKGKEGVKGVSKRRGRRKE